MYLHSHLFTTSLAKNPARLYRGTRDVTRNMGLSELATGIVDLDPTQDRLEKAGGNRGWEAGI
jgi:hypothetical protein